MQYITGNLLEANTKALVNTVNTVGVMGKGIALQFKERFPENYRAYAAACKRGEMKIGKMLVVNETTLEGEKIIVNFPTKQEWFKNSRYSYIEDGLKDLANVIEKFKIESISVPPLGCGNGGLKWEKVKSLLEQYLLPLKNVEILIYSPNDSVKEILQKETTKKNIELKPGRAMLLYALFKYERFGETASVFVANKLAYFLQKSGESLKLNFVQYTYGPYDHAIEKVLYSLNGKYLTGMEQMQVGPFESLNLNYETFPEVEAYINKNLKSEQRKRLDNLFIIIDGFESTFSLEILSSIDFLLSNNSKMDVDDLLIKIQNWNSRKKDLIVKEHIEIAVQHLEEYRSSLYIN